MYSFDPTSYGPTIAALAVRSTPCELGPGRRQSEVESKLNELTDSSLFAGKQVVDRDMARCCHSALWLLHDFLDESHTISQEIHTQTGSYWHGIMHRREPDFGNAKYWFRQVGKHPIFERLVEAARAVGGANNSQKPSRHTGELGSLVNAKEWDPFLFVDLCKSALAGEAKLEPVCRAIAQFEWQILFDYCYVKAVGIAAR